MRLKLWGLVILLFAIQGLISLDTFVTGENTALTYAESEEIYICVRDQFYRVKEDLSGFKEISLDDYEQHRIKKEVPVQGVDALKVGYEQKGQDIYVRGVKIFTLQKDPENAWMDMHYQVREVYEIITKSNRLFYYIIHDNGMAPPSRHGETDDLVEVEAGKVIHQIKVYDNLQYVKDDVWRSTASYSSMGAYILTQHDIRGKLKDVDLQNLVLDYAKKHRQTYKVDVEDIHYMGDLDTGACFSLGCRDKGGARLPLIRFYEVKLDGKVSERTEVSKSLDIGLRNNQFVHANAIYSLDQDGQVLRRLKDFKNCYLGGIATDLGTFTQSKETAFSAKIPTYIYKNESYICLEDLALLGYSMKWDPKARVGHWTYSGKKTGKVHVFKKTVVYDNDVFATIKGHYVHIYNAEGYSLLSLSDAKAYIRN